MTRKPITQAEVDAARQRYAKEAEERWGHTQAWRESQRRSQTPQQEADAANAAADIFRAFGALAGTPPEAPEAQALVRRWQEHISAHHYPCTRDILAGLGEMYTQDERFRQSLDAYGEGTAELMRDAIRAYCAGPDS